MSLDFDAIFENGVLRPLRPIGLPDRAKVRVTIDMPTPSEGGGLRGCSGSITPETAAELRRIIDDEFEKVDERDW